MHLMNLIEGRKVGCWARLRARARKPPAEMFAAYAAMRAEQKREGAALGFFGCDIPWCHKVAVGRWVRTAAEIKASRVKFKGSVAQMEPVSVRCSAHIPSWRVGQYARLVQGVRVSAQAVA